VTLRARWVTLRARWVTLRFRWVTLRARWVTLRARWVTLRARWVTLRARWVTLRARWVTLRFRWVTLRARWVTLRARWVTLRFRWVTFRWRGGGERRCSVWRRAAGGACSATSRRHRLPTPTPLRSSVVETRGCRARALQGCWEVFCGTGLGSASAGFGWAIKACTGLKSPNFLRLVLA
jgi:hypothetical protein